LEREFTGSVFFDLDRKLPCYAEGTAKQAPVIPGMHWFDPWGNLSYTARIKATLEELPAQ
jgi:hypothetical protein